MNDIDFDELDRAVSSLIGKPKDQAGGPGSPSQTPAPGSAPASSPSSSPVPPRPSISPLSSAPRAATTPPAVRRGKFMDMVHPSVGPTATPPPRSSNMTPSGPTHISPVGKTIEPVQKAPVPQKPAMPTPMEVKKPEIPKPDELPEEPLLEAKAESHPETTDEPKKPDLSPPLFLSGTKVEKRPLGAFSSKEPKQFDVPAPAEEKPESTEADDAQKTANATGLPPELDEKLVALEAGDSDVANDRPDTPPAYPPEPESIKPEPKKASKPTIQQAAQSAAHSIPQQYRPKQAEPDMTPRPIFNTDNYAHPVAQPHAKSGAKKPWLWIVIIVILLAVGAGLGVGAYFLLG